MLYQVYYDKETKKIHLQLRLKSAADLVTTAEKKLP